MKRTFWKKYYYFFRNKFIIWNNIIFFFKNYCVSHKIIFLEFLKSEIVLNLFNDWFEGDLFKTILFFLMSWTFLLETKLFYFTIKG